MKHILQDWWKSVVRFWTAERVQHWGTCYPDEWLQFVKDREENWAGGFVNEICPVTGKYCIIWWSYKT